MELNKDASWNSLFSTELASTMGEEGEIALSRVKLSPVLSRMHVVCAEAYAELGEYQKALIHLKQAPNGTHEYDRNLFAISRCLRNGGYFNEADECAESAMRIARRKFREADFCHGAIGELTRTYAMAALVDEDKGKARSVKRSARILERMIISDLDTPIDGFGRIEGRAWDMEGALSAAGTIYHGGFKRHGERALEAIATSIYAVLVYPDINTPNTWLQLGSYAALLFHQMGRQDDAETMGDLVERASEILFSIDDELETEDDESFDDESLSFLDPLELHDRIRLFREQALIGIATGVKSLQEAAIKGLGNLNDSFEEQEEIDSLALRIFALAVESEVTPDMTEYEKSILFDEFDAALKELEETISNFDELGETHPAELSELGLSVVSAFYSLSDHDRRVRILDLAEKIATRSIASLSSLDAFLTVTQFSSITDSAIVELREGDVDSTSLMSLLGDKARELFRQNRIMGELISDSPELIGGASDEALDLDSNGFVVQRLASMGLYREARALAEHTVSDPRIKNKPRFANGSHLDSVWIDYLTGVFESIESPIVIGKGIDALPKTANQWLQFRG